jgi:NADH-quinone oxidoreductase subunit J
MSFPQILFMIVAVITLGAALMVVTVRNLIHSALWLILALFGVAIFYVVLSAGFFAVAQVVIYIGAIAILFIFAAMLTRRVMVDTGPQSNQNWWAVALVAILLFVSLIVILRSWPGFTTPLPEMTSDVNSLEELGMALVSPNGYLLPFELASVLLVAAMIGAIYVALEKK